MMNLSETQISVLQQLAACTTWEAAKVVSRQADTLCPGIAYSIGSDSTDAEFRRVRVTLPEEVMAAIGHPRRDTTRPMRSAPVGEPLSSVQTRSLPTQAAPAAPAPAPPADEPDLPVGWTWQPERWENGRRLPPRMVPHSAYRC